MPLSRACASSRRRSVAGSSSAPFFSVNPKCVRASAGSIFRLPVIQTKTRDLLPVLSGKGLRLLGTTSHKGTPLPGADCKGAIAICIGNEGAGLPKELLAKVDANIVIPHSNKVESLNAGVAASIVLYEAARQRAKYD